MTLRERIEQVRAMRERLNARSGVLPAEAWRQWDARLREIERDLADLLAAAHHFSLKLDEPMLDKDLDR